MVWVRVACWKKVLSHAVAVGAAAVGVTTADGAEAIEVPWALVAVTVTV